MALSESQIQAILDAAEKIEEKINRIEATAEKLKDADSLKEQLASIGAKQTELAKQLLDIQRAGDSNPAGGKKELSLGQRFVQSASFKDFVSGKSARATLSVDLAAITTPAGSVPPDRLPGVKGKPNLANVVESMFPHVATSSNLIEYLQENTFTNGAKATAEGAAKPESQITFSKKEAPVRTIAHWIRITKQLAQDSEAVAAFIDMRMAYGVARAIEKQILTGDGSGDNLSGIFKSGNFVPHGFTASAHGADFDGLDAIRRSAAVMSVAGYHASHVILNPLDYDDILGKKDKQGRYLFGDPSKSAGSTVWGLQPVISPEVTKGQFMVADPLMGGTVYERTGIDLQAFEQDGDNVTKNLITVRAEKRIAFSVDVVDCFVGGALKIA